MIIGHLPRGVGEGGSGENENIRKHFEKTRSKVAKKDFVPLFRAVIVGYIVGILYHVERI